jgi:hypothetical protein
MQIRDTDQLRELYRKPSGGAVLKQQARLDDNCRSFIAHSPFVVIATADAEGRCDASPKGGPPGFVKVLGDGRLAVPDLSGNNRLDSMQNILSSQGIALLFFVPGIDESMRVNGRATLSTDPSVLDACVANNARPRVAIVVDVDEAFIHCAKAFRRGGIWKPDAWPDTSDMPRVASMLRDHVGIKDRTVDEVAQGLEDSYVRTLWEPGGEKA